MKEEIDLGCFGIRVTLTKEEGEETSGTICSDLHEGDGEDVTYSAAMSAIETIVLEHACAGVDIKDLAYMEGLETAIQMIIEDANNEED